MHVIWILVHSLVLATMTSATAVLSLPPDRNTTVGPVIHNICGKCCQHGSYCGRTQAPANVTQLTIPKTNKGMTVTTLTVPKDTNMTCILRDRSVRDAVDGGLCVPDLSAIKSPVRDFCLRNTEVSDHDCRTYLKCITTDNLSGGRCRMLRRHSLCLKPSIKLDYRSPSCMGRAAMANSLAMTNPFADLF